MSILKNSQKLLSYSLVSLLISPLSLNAADLKTVQASNNKQLSAVAVQNPVVENDVKNIAIEQDGAEIDNSFELTVSDSVLDLEPLFLFDGIPIAVEDIQNKLTKPIRSTSVSLTVDGEKARSFRQNLILRSDGINLTNLSRYLRGVAGHFRLDSSFDLGGQSLELVVSDRIKNVPTDFKLNLDDDWNARVTNMTGSLAGKKSDLADLLIQIKSNKSLKTENITVALDGGRSTQIKGGSASVDLNGLSFNGLNAVLSKAKHDWSACGTYNTIQGDLKLCVTSALVPERYVVKLRKSDRGVDNNSQARELVSQYNGRLGRVFNYAIDGFSASFPADVIKELTADPRVELVSRDTLFYLHTIQNPVFSWGQDRIDERQLNLDSRFTYEDTGTGTNVFVIDSGIRNTHIDFTGRIGAGASFVAGAFDEDCIGHGTHVSGTAAGTIFGLAKGATIRPVRVFGCTGGAATSTIVAGIDWVTANAAAPAVVNMSLGGPANTFTDTAVQNSINAGFTYVVSAGNDNRDACNYSPARVNDAITIGATRINDKRWKYWSWAAFRTLGSNKGNCVDIFAPGHNIQSANFANNTGGIANTGTSMAAPHVAGIAALMLESQPAATPATIMSQVLSTGTSNVLSSVGSGSPNLMAFWKQACTDPVAHFTGGSIFPWFDGANCYVMPVPSGASPFIWSGSYYIQESYTNCPLGSYDGANCYVMPKPAGGFIWSNNFYTTYDSCSIGTNDSANCYINSAPAGTTAFIYAGNFYYTPLPGNVCPFGWFDGANCYVMPMPPGGFIYANNFYTSYDACSIGTNDGANCYIASAPAGTTAFIYAGNFYTTPDPSTPTCIDGAYDGANCYIGTAPAGSTPFIWGGNFYYAD